MQYSFINFLATVIASDEHTTLELCSETKLWDLIASRAFLHGGVARIHGSLPEAFECTRTRDGNGNVIEVSYRYSQVKVTDTDTKNRALHALAWMILHDRLLDFASAHLKGAFKLIKSEGLTMQTFRAILHGLTSFSLSGEVIGGFVSDTLICSGVRWIVVALRSSPWPPDHFGEAVSQTVIKLFSLMSAQSYRSTGINCLLTSAFEYDDKYNPLLVPARYIVTDVLMDLLSVNTTQSWFIEAIKPGYLKHMLSLADLAAGSSASINSACLLKENEIEFSILNEDARALPSVMTTKGGNDGRIILIANNILPVWREADAINTNQILLLLLDPLMRFPTNIILRIIYLCCTRIVAAGNIDNKELATDEATLNASYSILKSIIAGLMDFIANCSIYQKRCESLTTVAYVLRALTWMLRDEACRNIRETLQTIFYNNKVVSYVYNYGIQSTIHKSKPGSDVIGITPRAFLSVGPHK